MTGALTPRHGARSQYAQMTFDDLTKQHEVECVDTARYFKCALPTTSSVELSFVVQDLSDAIKDTISSVERVKLRNSNCKCGQLVNVAVEKHKE